MTVLGLDIGGANLKAATPDKRAVSVPFALWKQPDRLPAALAELVKQFPDAEELAVTMTGELCDCFETKRDGVNTILDATVRASGARPVRVWSTDGAFETVSDARWHPLTVAAANWHALATFAGAYVPDGPAVLIDVGSTTADVIPIFDGIPIPTGLTDMARLESRELIYAGVRRTPLAALAGDRFATELFATTLDVYLHLGMIPEDETDTDTADGRPATRKWAFDRLCRMFCGDRDTIARERIDHFAEAVRATQLNLLARGLDAAYLALEAHGKLRRNVACVTAGAGEFLATRAAELWGDCREVLSLTDRLGPRASACAPAYAVAVLRAERR
jgi:probable H4MPT-linked C1 transfer pathway protein